MALAASVPGAERLLRRSYTRPLPALETTVAGVRFPNPIGVAAGFDKDCRLPGILPALGFGFVEVGTVTLRPQRGNPKPRMFRVPKSLGLINRLGFNNAGADAAAARLAKLKARRAPIGVNIGINADVSEENAPFAYAQAFSKLEAFGDYFVVNVSSPNTPGLRRFQGRERLERVLDALDLENPRRKPVFVKLAPDLSDAELDAALPLLVRRAAGVVCTNTTLSRPSLPEPEASLAGGLSGAPLRELSTRMIGKVFQRTGGRLPIIGVGGIFNADDAYEKICAGASLVQVYTGFIYQGPSLPREIAAGLARRLALDGHSCVSAAVGRSAEYGRA